MKIIVWLGRIILFVFFFIFALFNTEAVMLNYLLGQWQAPLALVLLIFFLAGVLFGMAVLLPAVFRQRLEIKRLGRGLPPYSSLPVVQEATAMPASRTADTQNPYV